MADLEPLAGISQDGTLQQLLAAIRSLSAAIGTLTTDTGGRLRVTGDPTISVSSIQTAPNVSGVNGLGAFASGPPSGYSAAPQIPALSLLSEGDLRRNIVIS